MIRRIQKLIFRARIDFSYLFQNPVAFLLPTALMIVFNVILFNVENSHHQETLPKILLMPLFLVGFLSIPLENREKYSDRIILELGNFAVRVQTRIVSIFLISSLMNFPFLIFFANQHLFPALVIKLSPLFLFKYLLANMFTSVLGVRIGSLFRSYNFATAVMILLILAKYQLGADSLPHRIVHFITEGGNSLSESNNGFQLALTICIIAILFFANFRGFRRINVWRLFTKRRQSQKIISYPVWLRFFKNHPIHIALAQFLTIRSLVFMVPFSISSYVLYPLASTNILESTIPGSLASPLICALLLVSLFSCVVAMGAYAPKAEEAKSESLLYKSESSYLLAQNQMFSIVITLIAVFIYSMTGWLDGAVSNSFLIFARGLAAILFLMPPVVSIAERISKLRIDRRYFVLLSMIPTVGEMFISSVSPGLISWLPSSLFSKLAGGKGIYVLAKNSPEPRLWQAFILVGVLCLFAIFFNRKPSKIG